MPHMHELHQNPEPTPAHIVVEAMAAAERGEMPSFTSESLLTTLGLDGEVPDQKTLMDRFMGDSSGFGAMRDIPALMGGTQRLIIGTNEYTANLAQETVAQALGQVVTRQLMREGDICPGARDIALNSTREDIIPTDVKQKIQAEEQLDDETIDENEEGLEEFARDMEAVQQMLPQILRHVMMEGMHPNTQGRPLIIPIIIGRNFTFPAEGSNQRETTAFSEAVQRATEAQTPQPDEGNVCMRALKNLCHTT